MKLKFTYERSDGSAVDLAATFDSSATVGDLADHIVRSDPGGKGPKASSYTLRLTRDGRTLDPQVPLAEADAQSGAIVSAFPASAGYEPDTPSTDIAAVVTITAGPGEGTEFPLGRGSFVLGRERECHVVLPDPMVSRRHARVNITDVVEIIDLGSANGTTVGGAVTARAVLRSHDLVQLGDTVVSISMRHLPAMASSVDVGSAISFVRSPTLAPVYPGKTFQAPEPPEPAQRQRLPLISLLAPLLMGGVLFAITRQVASLAFIALSPMMMIGSVLEQRRHTGADFKASLAAYESDLADLRREMLEEASREVQARCAEVSSCAQLIEAATHRTPLLWSQRADLGTFGRLRLGLAQLPSRNTVELPRGGRASRELKAKAVALATDLALVGPVPLTADLSHSALGLAGARRAALGCARGLVVEAVVLHSPAELAVACLVSLDLAQDWDWLKWLPHVSSPHSPLHAPHLAATQNSGNQLLLALEELVEGRPDDFTPSTQNPAVLVVIDTQPPVEHSRLVELSERGPTRGVYVLWLVPDAALIPASCKTFVTAEIGSDDATVGFVSAHASVAPVHLETVEPEQALDVSRALAPVVDVGARVLDASDLPRSVSQLALIGRSLGDDAEAIIERWRENNSVMSGPYAPPQLAKRVGHLRAVIGQSASGPHAIDLRRDGPHALVGGTTGAGKSELLQSWVLAMAAAHSPQRLTFLFVDYKGGAAFAECAELPHSIGVVTDLNTHEVHRALRSLNAELKTREELLARHQAKDLAAMEAMGLLEAPPSLVIVVDEFAALVTEVPKFVDGMVNVAQRGRSLGLHLVLATQRPAGVIKDNLRANTNLRIALRMADADDSTDVLGAPDAAAFDQDLPGRAMSKSGARPLVPFQAAYSGARTTAESETPEVVLDELSFTAAGTWGRPAASRASEAAVETDIVRLVVGIKAAHVRAALPEPRKAWLPGLGSAVSLRELEPSKTDAELFFAQADDPDAQSQPAVAYHPDQEANIVFYGASGAGKSTALKTLAVAAGYASIRTPVQVYALDFASQSLAALEELPHVGAVAKGTDHERLTRVLTMLRGAIDERYARYSAADNITAFRRQSGVHEEPRLLLLLDGLPAFRQAYETTERQRWIDTLESILSDGRAVGVNVAMTSDQRSGLTTAMSSAVQRRVVLRMASAEDYSMLGAPVDVLSSESPPGRALDRGQEIQIALLEASAEGGAEVKAITEFARSLARSGVAQAPAIRRLPDLVPLVSVPDGLVLGIESATLQPLAVSPEGAFLVTGPPGSGRTTTLLTLLRGRQRLGTPAGLHLLGQRRSPLIRAEAWTTMCTDTDEMAAWASDLTARLEAADPGEPRQMILIEDAGGFTMSAGAMALEQLVKVALAEGHWLVAEGEANSLTYGSGYLGALKASRCGIALQPDQETGSAVFRTPFPRLSRADFPAGRGLYVKSGRTLTVQVAAPWEAAADG